jgi:hypothetical protein
MRSATMTRSVLVDGHAHLHPVFEPQGWFAAAAANITRAALANGISGEEAVGALLLAEGRAEGAFARLQAVGSAAGRWSVHATDEPESVLVRESGRLRLIVVAGRQIVTAEQVEVLGLLSGQDFADGVPLADTVHELKSAGAVAVLPWGFGKWILRRGALVTSLLESGRGGIFLGDNGGRLAAARLPRLLADARRQGVPVLAGSDPLPFPDQQSRIASFGFVANMELDEDRPARVLRAWLHGLKSQPRTYGDLETLGRFGWNQARMHWRKRVTRGG